MASRIAFNDEDGYVHILTPAYNDKLRDWSKTDDEIIDECIAGLAPGTAYIVIDDEKPDARFVLLQRDKRDDWIITDDGLAIKS